MLSRIRRAVAGALVGGVLIPWLVPSPSPAAVQPPWIGAVLERLKTLGMVPLWVGATRPIPAADLRAALKGLEEQNPQGLGAADRRWLDLLRREAGLGGGDPAEESLTASDLARAYGIGRSLISLDLARKGRELTLGWAVDSPVAAVWIGGPGGFVLGRERLGWGPAGEGGLLFSDAAPPFDRVQYSTVWAGVRYTKLVGWLDGGRSVAAARADWMVRPNLRLGFSESIVMEGGPYWLYIVQPVPILINQFLSHVLRGQQQSIDDNYLGAVDFEWLPRRGLRLFGEALIDDLTVPPNPYPWRWGATLGFQTMRPEGSDYLLQYTIVPNWTYSASRPTLHYLLRGLPLAHPLGADFDAIHLRWTPPAGPWTLWATYVRKGEGEVGRFWTDLTEATTYAFLRGVVEYTTLLGVDLQVAAEGAGFDGVVRPWVARWENAGHVPGAVRVDWGVEISARWSGP